MEWYKVLLILSVVTPILVNGQFRSNPFLSRQTQSQSNQVQQGYQIPKPTAIALSPGFQIKIPGMKLIASSILRAIFLLELTLIRCMVFPVPANARHVHCM